MQEKRKTLGKNVIPTRYTLEFRPNLSTFKFNGNEEIEVNVRKKTNSITLNSSELKIKSASVESIGTIQIARVEIDAKNECITLRLKKPVSDKAKLRIDFSGINNNKLHGFYKSRYLDGKTKRYLLTTQFEPADARKCFPCFDEPAMKAYFKVAIVAGKDFDCISNTPVESVEAVGKSAKRVNFRETLKMSTYLIYLGVGNFEYLSGRLGKIKITVNATKGKMNLLSLPFDYSKKFVKFFEAYFNIKYPLPKLDLIAIPDFAEAAMENWGAITFRETDLLGTKNSSLRARQRIAEVIAHEIAHQWFGDLVTMEWWDDLWLNESFATFMSYKAIAEKFPHWVIGEQLFPEILDSMTKALNADQLRATHPISTKVNNPKEISAIFDNISYDKGGSLLYMIEDYTGRETFREGLHAYLKKHSYQNATQDDLWRAIDSVAKKHKGKESVGHVASYWINTKGYLVVYVEKTKDGVKLTQRKFLISSDGSLGHWPVPVHYATSRGKEGMVLLSSPSHEIKLKLEDGEYIKLNREQKGFYRVWYEKELLSSIGNAIKDKKIGSIDAWGVENDLFIFARSGKIAVKEYLSFVSKYCSHADYPVNENILSHLNWFYLMLYDTKLAPAIEEMLIHNSHVILDKIGMKTKRNEKSTDTLLRGEALANLGFVGDEEIVAQAKQMFGDFLKNKTPIDSDLKSAVLSTVARNGDDKTFEKIKELYLKEHNPEDKIRFLVALGLFPSKKLAGAALRFTLSQDVRYQDAYMIPVTVTSNPVCGRLIWDWTRSNWKLLRQRYPPSTTMLKLFVQNLGLQNGARERRDIASFFSGKEAATKDVDQEVKRTLERIDSNINLMRINGLVKD